LLSLAQRLFNFVQVEAVGKRQGASGQMANGQGGLIFYSRTAKCEWCLANLPFANFFTH
jgi:hypothetical protein